MDGRDEERLAQVEVDLSAIEHLLFGLARVLRRHNVGISILNEAFDEADNLAKAVIGQEPDVVRDGLRAVLATLAEYRKHMLG